VMCKPQQMTPVTLTTPLAGLEIWRWLAVT